MEEDLFNQPKQLFIIDGYGLIYRSYFALISKPLKDPDGKNVSALFGFFNTLMMIIRKYKPAYLVIALDSKGKTFRHELYPLYKANRDKTPEDLHAQIPRIEEILDAVNIPHIAKPGMEADDIIATLVRQACEKNLQSVMVTGDKDLLQLVNPSVSALRPARKGESELRLFKENEVKEAYGVNPDQIVDYLTILGDSSDNVPGVDGIGEKGAVKLLTAYGNLEGIYSHLDEMAAGVRSKLEAAQDKIDLSRTLVRLKSDLFTVPTFDCDQYTTSNINWAKAATFFDAIDSKSLAFSARKIANESGSQVIESNLFDLHAEQGVVSTGEYKAVTDLEELRDLLNQALKVGTMAFDFETTDIDDMKAKPVGFSFSFESCKAYYVPLICGSKRVLEDQPVKEILQEFLPKLQVVGQNLKYDLKVLIRWGVKDVVPWFDTMLAAWLIDSSAGLYNMDDLALVYLNYTTVKFSDVVPKNGLFSDVSLENAVKYAAEDSDITFRLYEKFVPLLKEKGLFDVLMNMEMPILRILCDMELEGVGLEKSKLTEFSIDLQKELNEIQSQIFTLCGKEFNLNSPKQLQEILFVDRELPTGKKTKQGFSTDSDVLEELASSTDDPVVPLILQYRILGKLQNTYVQTLPLLINPETGRIHTSFLQTGTATGRLSSRNPNLQNIPVRTEEGRRIRSAFVPKEGCLFLSADYSQIELVVLAHVSKDVNLQRAFIEGHDVHKETAALIFNVFSEMVTPEQRRIAKTINFGVIYGMSAFRLSRELKIPRKEAQSFIDSYFERYVGIKTFIDQTRENAKSDVIVRTLMGHQRPVTEMRSVNKAVLAAAERIVVNTVIQGTAAEIMKLAMISISKEMKSRNLKSKLLLQVHDEVIFEVPENECDTMKELVKKCMENAYKMSVPLKVGIETGKSWGDIH